MSAGGIRDHHLKNWWWIFFLLLLISSQNSDSLWNIVQRSLKLISVAVETSTYMLHTIIQALYQQPFVSVHITNLKLLGTLLNTLLQKHLTKQELQVPKQFQRKKLGHPNVISSHTLTPVCEIKRGRRTCGHHWLFFSNLSQNKLCRTTPHLAGQIVCLPQLSLSHSLNIQD